MPPPREPWSGFGAVMRAAKAWTMRLSSVFATAAPITVLSEPGLESEVADSSDLLKRRMHALHLDPDDLARDPAGMAGIKPGLCARCAARGKCMRDLDDEFADPAWGDWRNYCPNATSLSFLRTLHGYKEKPPEGG